MTAKFGSWTFRLGSRGPGVDGAQECLIKLGLDPGPNRGWFGHKMREAVKAFQSQHGLPATGELDALSLKKLYESAYPEDYPQGLVKYLEKEASPDLKQGEAEEHIRALGLGPRGAAIQPEVKGASQQPAKTIVISVGEKALGLFEDKRLIRKYPVAVGKPSTPTPIGAFRVLEKVMNPGGALGTRWLGFTYEMHGIHGTNRPDLIGQEVSNGCVRMYNQDVEELYDMVEISTPVIVIEGAVENWAGGGSASHEPGAPAHPGTPVFSGSGSPSPKDPIKPEGPREQSETSYVVRPGDTLWSIAQRFGTTVDRLVKLNNINNPDLIFPGQRLRIS